MRLAPIVLTFFLLLTSRGLALEPGLYETTTTKHVIYVGPEHEYPGPRYDEYFDQANGHIGHADLIGPLRLVRTIHEERLRSMSGSGVLGASLWFCGAMRNPTIVLIHGNDPETRQMGFLISFFALHGLTVISYDQRGTGESVGDWQASGPADRAADVEALIAQIRTNPHVDPKKVGVWAVSNGGWTAPIVATRLPLAFMILQSASAERLQDNIVYELEERLREHHFSEASVAEAANLERSLVLALTDQGTWSDAKKRYDAAAGRPWFPYSGLPTGFPLPPPPPVVSALQRSLIYDPSAVLKGVRTPTLALFGLLDRNVDAFYSARTFASDFRVAGMSDFTEKLFPHAGHSLQLSDTGYSDQPLLPRRIVTYPEVTLAWLQTRGFADARP